MPLKRGRKKGVVIGKRDGPYYRSTITIPKRLYDQLQERPDICLSRIATLAVEDALQGDNPNQQIIRLENRVQKLEARLQAIRRLTEDHI